MEKVKIAFISLIFVSVWGFSLNLAWGQNGIGSASKSSSGFKKVDSNAAATAPQAASAAPAAHAAPVAKGKEQVLDFEGEVIEGERRRPDLFLQMSIEQVKFDSLVFQRDDFNDYLEQDRKSRSRYLRYK